MPRAWSWIEEKRAEVKKEIADVITYCDLMLNQLNADTAEELIAKFNEVSRRVGWPEV